MRRAAGRGRWAVWAAVAAALVLALWLLPVNRWLLALVEAVRGAGAAGVALYVAAYVAACVLLLPGSVLTLGAGFLWGPLWGSLVVVLASNLGAGCAFVLGRTLLRARVARRVEGDARFAAVDRAVGAQGLKVVMLLRLSPLFPFNVLNYALGLTRVSFRDAALGSFVGMLPGTVLYVYLGSLVTSAAQLASGQRPDAGGAGRALFWGGLVATLAVTVLVTRVARRALQDALATPEETPRP